MLIYRRCKQWGTLPRAGGLLEQDERLMELLDVVDNVVDGWKAKRMEDERNDAMKQSMASKLRGRHG